MNKYDIGDRVLLKSREEFETYSERAKEFLIDYDCIFIIRTITYGMTRNTFTMEETGSMIWFHYQIDKIVTKQKQIIQIQETIEHINSRFEILDL